MSHSLGSCLSAFALLSLGSACQRAPDEAAEHRGASERTVSSSPSRAPASSPGKRAESCERERARIMQLPALPGAPALEAARTRILGATKAEPVIFVGVPTKVPSEDSKARTYQRTLDVAKYPWDVMRWLVPRFALHPEYGRAALLRDGYLYADDPDLAFALASHVRAHHLFDADRIYIQRGEETLFAVRGEGGKYRYDSGPERGKLVKLLLFDRVGTGEVPPRALHRDLRALRYELFFDSARIVRLTEERIVADLRYGDDWVPTVLASKGSHVELVCEAIPEKAAERVGAFRIRAARKERLLEPLRDAMVASIEEQLPFDEPITEYGQQDGHMRVKWLQAYMAGRTRYKVNGDQYYVFDQRGRPQPPQVCIDFLYDTFERASGTWWKPRGTAPRRVVGKVDFGAFTDTTLRRADRFIDLARRDPERFEVKELAPAERIPMWDKARFLEHLTVHGDDYVPGDVIVIRGYTSFEKPWQRRVMHYHTFFVYERDPVSGMPIALVGNPGLPSIRTWMFEGNRTPKRSIWYRVRPKLAWLEKTIATARSHRPSPPPLSIGPDV